MMRERPIGRWRCCGRRSPWTRRSRWRTASWRSEEHTSELQSRLHLVCRLLLEKKKRTLGHSRAELLIHQAGQAAHADLLQIGLATPLAVERLEMAPRGPPPHR